MHRADAQGGQKKAPAQKPPALPAVPASAAPSTPEKSAAAPQQSAASPATDKRKRSPLGTNLDSITDWSSSFPFVDAMKRSREWSSTNDNTWEDQKPMPRDDSDWIKQLAKGQYARTLLFWDVPEYPAGDYTL
ncbi:MAG TPA: hypothetical protein VFX59_04960, partial [Polyangiales bacterium]|nr:hypothetical protein [Polyangiales bacterium]